MLLINENLQPLQFHALYITQLKLELCVTSKKPIKISAKYAISLDFALIIYFICNYKNLAYVLYLSVTTSDLTTQRQN
jgi:hypothetical protein